MYGIQHPEALTQMSKALVVKAIATPLTVTQSLVRLDNEPLYLSQPEGADAG